MIRISLFIVFTLLFTGCSVKTINNKFEHKTTNAFKSYTHNFLSSNKLLANEDLKKAIRYSKHSASLDSLGRIYVGKCALDISVGIKSSCKKYVEIKDLIQDTKQLDAYYYLITKDLKKQHISYLPKTYQSFALHLLNKQYTKAYEDIVDMKSVTSKLISASLIKEYLNIAQIKYITNQSSFYGYKKSNIFWLNILYQSTINQKEKDDILKKISILKSR